MVSKIKWNKAADKTFGECSGHCGMLLKIDSNLSRKH